MDSHDIRDELVNRLRKRCAELEDLVAVLREQLGDE